MRRTAAGQPPATARTAPDGNAAVQNIFENTMTDIAEDLAPVRRQMPTSPTPLRQAITRPQLREIVPLGDTKIWEMEQRGQFPRRFLLTPRCVVWDLAEVEAWLALRRPLRLVNWGIR